MDVFIQFLTFAVWDAVGLKVMEGNTLSKGPHLSPVHLG